MKKTFFIILILPLLFSCKNYNKTPDVSNIKVELNSQRFEEDFFKMDTINVLNGLNTLQQNYPLFLKDFIGQVLGFTSQTPPDTLSKYIKYFIRDYKFVKDSSDKVYGNIEPEINDIKEAFRFAKYYFPAYKLPTTLITFIGPFDGYSDLLTSSGLAVGLQLHMGANFSFYKSQIAHDLFPEYITQRFTKDYIPVNAVKNIIDDMFSNKTTGKALIEQMVENGKRIYLLDKLMPATKDYLKIGYSEKQLKDCYKNEPVIWDFFLQNELLNNSDQNITKNYIGEGPKTQELGDDSPGNIASFSGWQIVKKYMDNYPETKLQVLMNMDPRELYSKSKYKPKS